MGSVWHPYLHLPKTAFCPLPLKRIYDSQGTALEIAWLLCLFFMAYIISKVQAIIPIVPSTLLACVVNAPNSSNVETSTAIL